MISMSRGFGKSKDVKKYSWVEIATATFAFLNVIAASIILLICLGFLFMWIVEAVIVGDVTPGIWYLCLGTNSVVLVVFIFAVLLYLGIYMKKPGFVLTYFIFGVLVDIGIAVGVVVLYYVSFMEMTQDWRDFFDYYYEITHALIGICVVYTIVVVMTCRTWCLMTSRRSNDHEKLYDDYYESDWRYQ